MEFYQSMNSDKDKDKAASKSGSEGGKGHT